MGQLWAVKSDPMSLLCDNICAGKTHSVSYFYLFVNLSFTKDFKVVLSCIFLSREEAAVRSDPISLCDNVCAEQIFS